MTNDMHMHTAATLPLERIITGFGTILLIWSTAKMIYNTEDDIQYFRHVWVEEEAIVNDCYNICNM